MHRLPGPQNALDPRALGRRPRPRRHGPRRGLLQVRARGHEHPDGGVRRGGEHDVGPAVEAGVGRYYGQGVLARVPGGGRRVHDVH